MAAPAARPDLRRAAPGGAIRRPVVALTSGEPAGVGPELCARAARESFAAKLVVIGDRSLLPGAEVQHVPLRRPCVPGKLDPGNSRATLNLALATGPGITAPSATYRPGTSCTWPNLSTTP